MFCISAGFAASNQQVAGYSTANQRNQSCVCEFLFLSMYATPRALSVVQPKDICSRGASLNRHQPCSQHLLLISPASQQSIGLRIAMKVMLTISHNPAATDICKMEHLTERHGPRLTLCLQEQTTKSKAGSWCCVSQTHDPPEVAL